MQCRACVLLACLYSGCVRLLAHEQMGFPAHVHWIQRIQLCSVWIAEWAGSEDSFPQGEVCYACGLLCVSPFSSTSSSWVRSTARISVIPYKHCQQASREWLLPCSWHSRCAPGCSILLLLQRPPQVWRAPSHGDYILLLSRGVGGTEESGFSQYLQDVWAPRGRPEIGYKVAIQHGAQASAFSSFINSALLLHGSIWEVLCSFLTFPWAPAGVFSTGLVPRSCSWLYEHNSSLNEKCYGSWMSRFCSSPLKTSMNVTKACSATFLICITSVHL